MERITYGRKKRLLARLFEALGWLVCAVVARTHPRKQAQSGFRILILEPFQMGDIVALSALLGPLRAKYPGCFIAFSGKKGSLAIASFFDGVDACFPALFPWTEKTPGLGKWKKWFGQMLAFRQQGFDLGIDVRGDVRSQVSLRLAGCGRVLSYRRYIYSDIVNQGWLVDFLQDDCPHSHILDRNRFLLKALGMADPELFPIRFPLVQKSGSSLSQNQKADPELLVHIGSSWHFKRWPPENWAILLDSLSTKFSGLKIRVIAGPDEQELMESVRKLTHAVPGIVFDFPSLEGLFDAIGGCALLIGCDSGPMVIANVLDVPRITLFGPGPPTVWGPYTDRGRFLQKIEGYSCYPCEQIQCVRSDSPCIAQIRPRNVEYLATGFLEKGAFPS